MGRSQGSRAGLNSRPTNRTLESLPTKDAQRVWKREQIKELKRINQITDPAKRAYEQDALRSANARGLARVPQEQRSDRIKWDSGNQRPFSTPDSMSLSERARLQSQSNVTQGRSETRGRPSGNLNRPRLSTHAARDRRRRALIRLQRIWKGRSLRERQQGRRFKPNPVWND